MLGLHFHDLITKKWHNLSKPCFEDLYFYMEIWHYKLVYTSVSTEEKNYKSSLWQIFWFTLSLKEYFLLKYTFTFS